VSLFLSLGFWAIVLVRGGAGGGGLRPAVLEGFGFPNVLQYFVYWFALGWPVFLAATTLVGAIMLRRYFTTREPALLYLPAGILIPIVLSSFFSTYQESRYVFHVYPLLVVGYVWGIMEIVERLRGWKVGGIRAVATLAGVFAVALLATGDVGRGTIAPLTRTYGDTRDVMRSIISWPAYGRFHQDQVGAARYVREHMSPGDQVVAIGLPHQLHVYRFYAGRLDAALTRAENSNYQRRREGVLVDRFTGATLVTDVHELTSGSGATTWLIGDTVLMSEDVEYFPSEVRRDARRVADGAVFRGRDGVTYVVKLP
jgi:hypothetical protein